MTPLKEFSTLLWNSPVAMSWASLVIRLGGFFILMALALNHFSNEEISLWLLFFSISSIILLADFGFSQTFAREINYGFAGYTTNDLFLVKKKVDNKINSDPNWDTISAVYYSMDWLYRRLALGALAIAATIGSWAVIIPIERTSDTQGNYIAWSFIVATLTVTIYGYRYTSFLLGADKIAEQKRWEFIVNFIGMLAQCSALLLEISLLGLIILSQLTLITQVIVNRFLARKITSTLINKLSFNKQKKVISAMWPTAWRTAVGVFSAIGVTQGILIVMINILPVGEAASLQLSVRIMQTIGQFSQIPFYTKVPFLNRLQASRNTKLLTDVAQKNMRFSLWLFTLTAIIAGYITPLLLNYIGSSTKFVEHTFWGILMAAFFLERYGAMHLQLYSTTRIIIWHIANGITGIFFIILINLFYENKIIIFPISMFFSYIFYIAYVTKHSYKIIYEKSTSLFEVKTSLPQFSLIILFITNP